MIQIEKDRFRPNEAYFVEHHNRPGWWVYQGSFPVQYVRLFQTKIGLLSKCIM